MYTASTSIALSVNPTSVAESASGTTVTVTATVNDGAPTSPITVSLGTLAGTATSGTGKDYTHNTLNAITIAANAVSGATSFTITPVNDVIDEGSGETIIVSGSTTASGFTGGVSSATVTLTDNDNAPSGITLSLEDSGGDALASVAEDDGATTVTVKATVTGGTTFSTQQVVAVSVSGSGTATAVDFTDVANFNITIPAATASAEATFTLTPTDDVVDETNETITVSGALSGVTVTGTTLSLTDDDDAPTGITLSANPNTVTESAAKTVTVTATVTGGTTYATAKTVTVSVDGSGTAGAVDFTAVDDFTITIASGVGVADGNVHAHPHQRRHRRDRRDHHDQRLRQSGITVTSGTLALTDDDDTPSGITLTANPTSVNEGDGATTVTVTATVNGATRYVDAKTVAVSVAASGSAGRVDFTAVDDFNIAIAAGGGVEHGHVHADPRRRRDRRDQRDHHHQRLVGHDHGDLRDGGTGRQRRRVDPDHPVGEHRQPRRGRQLHRGDGDGQAERVGADDRHDGDAGARRGQLHRHQGHDYADPGALDTITISANSKSGTATVNLDPTQDNLDEGTGETIRIGGTHSDSLTVTTVDITITDDDDTPTDVDLSVSPASVSETDTGATTITVSARLRGDATRTSATPVTVNSTLGGTATAGAGNDYTHSALSGTTITIPAGQFDGSSTVTFDVTPLQDPTYEGTETIQVLGSTTTAGLTVNAATLDLNDADVPRIDLSIDADVASAGVQTTVREDDRALSVEITATHAPETSEDDKAQAVTVTVMVGATGSSAARGPDGDYTSVETVTVRIGANRDSGTARVRITPVQDDVVEGVEKIVFGGQVDDGSEYQVAPTDMTLLDDDTASTAFVLLVNRDSIPERASSTAVRVTAELNGRTLAADSTVTLALSGAATEGRGQRLHGQAVAAAGDRARRRRGVGHGDGQHRPRGRPHRRTRRRDRPLQWHPRRRVAGADGGPGRRHHRRRRHRLDHRRPDSRPQQCRRGRLGHGGHDHRQAGGRGDPQRGHRGDADLGAGRHRHPAAPTTATPQLPGSITIDAGELSATATAFNITPTQDTANEGVETIIVNGTLAGFKVHGATVWLVDDEVDSARRSRRVRGRAGRARNAVRLTWEAATAPDDKPVTAYRLERRTDRGEWEVVSEEIADTAVSHSDSGLEFDTVYWWRLSAQNDDGWGPATAELEVQTGSRPPPVSGGGGGGPAPERAGPSEPEPLTRRFQLDDVEESSVFHTGISTMLSLGIFTGDVTRPARGAVASIIRFDPAEEVTRGDIAAPLVRLWQVLDHECPATEQFPFGDVSGDEARADVGCMLALGITNGTGADTYSPARPITRAQIATMLIRLWTAAGRRCPEDAPLRFADIGASFHRGNIVCLHALGITNGTGADTYSPDRSVTKAEAATLFARLHALVTTEEDPEQS